jgi:hypothetical protein
MIKIKLILILFSTILLWPYRVSAGGDHSGAKGSEGYYDTHILDDGSSSGSHKALKKKKHHHRKGAKKNNGNSSQSAIGPQEDVTDQKEVSQQADQTNQHHKK